MVSPPRIVFFQRKKRDGGRNFSLEQIFEDVRNRLSTTFTCKLWIAPFRSNGILKRMLIAVSAAFSQGDVNHVTGDINFTAIFLHRRKTVLTILDCGILERTVGLKRFFVRWLWFQLPIWRSRYVTVISESTKRSLLREVRCQEDKIKVVPVAISSRFVSDPREFNSAWPTILQIGTAPNKNLTRLVQALNGMRCRLRIVGPLRDREFRELASNQIEFEHFQNLSQSEIVQCYRECDIVAFVSTSEGFGMPILEANATGRPVVTSAVSSMPEVAGDAACLVDPMDIQSIRIGLERIIEDAAFRSALIAHGYRNLIRFDPSVIAQQYADIYKLILAERGE